MAYLSEKTYFSRVVFARMGFRGGLGYEESSETEADGGMKKQKRWLYLWKANMPFAKKAGQIWPDVRKMQIDRDKAIMVYVLLKNGADKTKVDPAGSYRRAYKHLVGWHTVVKEDGTVLKGPDPEIVRLHEEGIL